MFIIRGITIQIKINKYNAMYGHGVNFKEDAFIVFIILGASK